MTETLLPMLLTERIKQAQQFAHMGHDSIGQRRKYSDAPYWVHTDEVARIVCGVLPVENAVIAAHQHDLVEDVFPINPEYSLARIEKEFGREVSMIVDALTDKYTKESFPHMNRAMRKRAIVDHYRSVASHRLAREIHTTKVADLLSNTRDIVENDPGFAVVYLQEKEALLRVLTKCEESLLDQAWYHLTVAKSKLGL